MGTYSCDIQLVSRCVQPMQIGSSSFENWHFILRRRPGHVSTLSCMSGREIYIPSSFVFLFELCGAWRVVRTCFTRELFGRRGMKC